MPVDPNPGLWAMKHLQRLLSSWWKEERHTPATPMAVRSALSLALLLLSPLFLIHLRHRALTGQTDQQQRLQEGLGIVEAAYGPLSRAALDWGHWDSLYSFVGGTNPNFPRTDIQTTALFDGGILLLLLDQNDQLRLSHAVAQHRPKSFASLVHCAQAGLHELTAISSTVRQIGRAHV